MKRNRLLYVLMLICLGASACQPSSEIPQVSPTATLISGLKMFSSKTVEIWLPESYQGGEPSEYLPTLIEQLKKGEDLQRLSARNLEFLLKEKPELLQFSGFVLDEQNNIMGTILFMKVPTTNGVPLDESVDAANRSVESIAKVKSKANIKLNNYDAIQVVLESMDGTGNNSIMYYIEEGNDVWILNYSVNQSIYTSSIEEIEQSAKTFKILPGN